MKVFLKVNEDGQANPYSNQLIRIYLMCSCFLQLIVSISSIPIQNYLNFQTHSPKFIINSEIAFIFLNLKGSSMQQSERLNSEIGLEQKNSILQAWADFKDAIFNVLFVILDRKSAEEQEETLLGLILESGLDYLQIMAFPFNLLVIHAWNGGNSLNHLANFFQQFNIATYLPGAPFSMFLVMLYALIFIILLIIADIVYVSYSFSKKKFRFTFPLIILAQIVPLFVTVLFLPISETLLSVVQCEADAEGVIRMSSFPSVVCWQGWHLFHASITLLITAIFVIISSVVALALFEPRMTSQKLTARKNSNAEVVFILNKIVLQFVFSFAPFQGPDFYVVIMFLLSFWQFWCYSFHKPYYTKTATKFYKMCSAYYFWTTLLLFVGLILGNYNFDGALVIWVSGLPFFAIIIFFESTSDVNTLFSSNLKFKTGQEVDAHLSYVLQLVCTQEQDRNSYMLLIGYIEKHKEICNESDCPLKAERKRHNAEDNMEYICSQVIKQLDRMFKNGIKKFSDCTKLRMSYAFFQLEHMKNKEQAYEEFASASKLDPSFQQQFNIYRFKKIIRENLQNREENEADLVETIRFENHVSLLEEAMLLSAKLHKEFWAELKEEIPDLKKLNFVGAQITEAGNSITENYGELSKMNVSACEVLYSYAHYLIFVSEDYNEGKQLLANARKLFQDRQIGHRNVQEIHFENDSINKMNNPLLVLTVTSPTAVPKINNTNIMFTQITGYQRQELINCEISKISPHLFTVSDQSCFQLLGKGDVQREGFINHKCNHLITVEYTVSQRNEETERRIFFKLASASNMKLVILAKENGQITDYNLMAQTFFKEMEAQMVREGKVLKLQDIGLADYANPVFKKQNGVAARINAGKLSGQYIVQVQPITVQVYSQNVELQDEEQKMVVVSEKMLGYRVNISKSEKNHFVGMGQDSSQQQLPEGSFVGDSRLDGGVLNLYDDPNTIDAFVSNLTQAKEQNNYRPFELAEKIKTMRLMNNQIKMVYNQGNENDYNDAAGQGSGDDQREMFKFDDESYQAKLRAAINTNLNHVQVNNLRRVSVVFMLLLFGLNILEIVLESYQVDSVNSFLHQISYRAQQYSLLTANMMGAIDPAANYTALYQQNQNHQIQFTADTEVEIYLQNNLTVSRNLRDAVIMLNSRLISFYQNPGSPSSIQKIFMNYVINIYPAFLNYPTAVAFDLSITYVLTCMVFLIAMLMMAYWIYISLKIDKKRYDIMIWFLDIPIPYVAHLGNHCDKYLKEFLTVKELGKKGIPPDEEEDSYEEYAAKKNAIDQEEIEQQIKARKSLISKNKKETLISKINLSSLKVLWLLVYSLFFSSLLLVFSQNFQSDFQFLLPQWIQTSQAVTIDNTLYLALKMQDYNITTESNLTSLISTLKMDHKGVITENSLEGFNYDILNFHLTDVANVYNNVYFNNLCLILPLNASALNQCQSVVGNKLKSGYEVYSKYLITPQSSKNSQIRIANQYYVIPALVSQLVLWDSTVTASGYRVINLCEILLYVFVILSVLCFLLFWLYYLRKMNTELNQTIQMLNMIPFKLLPKSRKETKLFIAWIIRQANKTKHENE